jgi:hypothetical protein
VTEKHIKEYEKSCIYQDFYFLKLKYGFKRDACGSISFIKPNRQQILNKIWTNWLKFKQNIYDKFQKFEMKNFPLISMAKY